MNKGLVFIGIGFELLGLVLGGLFVGQVVDREYNWPGYAVSFFILVGLVSWLLHLFFLAKKFMKDDENDQKNS